MPEELLERLEVPEVLIAPEEDLVPPAPPEGLDTVLYEHDERAARADLRRQIAAMELALARLFGSAFPRKGIDFAVRGDGRAAAALGGRARAGPRLARRPHPGGQGGPPRLRGRRGGEPGADRGR